jgi:DNA-directed RNA polymerase subunit RPC12/RpoP
MKIPASDVMLNWKCPECGKTDETPLKWINENGGAVCACDQDMKLDENVEVDVKVPVDRITLHWKCMECDRIFPQDVDDLAIVGEPDCPDCGEAETILENDAEIKD